MAKMLPLVLKNMRINSEWKDYEILATGNGEKLERWKDIILLRPDPQVIWDYTCDLTKYKINAKYLRDSGGGGRWEKLLPMPDEWTVSWRNLNFKVKPMGFKHTGLFPEQAVNWTIMIDLVKSAGRPISVLNLFAYTGGATLACLSAGARVCHIDAAVNMNERAKDNLRLSGLDITKARFIADDCLKFVTREIKRGKKYDAIIMDPPSYGRGPNGEMWKIEDNLFDLLKLISQVLTDEPLFVLLNLYTAGLAPSCAGYMLSLLFKEKYGGTVESDEIGILAESSRAAFPCGAFSRWAFN
ncbi:MAG: class I SAM-dependent methyltransferase [Firmicutes bacterium]|nr:class I SAM-dependent methyltransferase [Bacillota bacterium]